MVINKKVFNLNSIKSTRQMLRNNATAPETILWSKLKGKQLLGLKFRRQYSIENFIVDFYCPSIRLAIEVDGESHFGSEANKRDIRRQRTIEKYDIKFLRFTNLEITDNLTGVLEKIKTFIIE